MPYLFNSQSCESLFRQMRSMTTINYTKVNFSLLELFHLVGKIELLHDIMFFKLSYATFARVENKKKDLPVFELPTDKKIWNILNTAKNDAMEDLKSFGIYFTESDNLICEIQSVDLPENDPNSDDETEDEEQNDQCDLYNYIKDSENFKNYADKVDDISETDPFVEVKGKNGMKKVVRKSSVLWLLETTKETLSSDRLKRVQNKKSSCRGLQFSSLTLREDTPNFYKVNEILLGNWCFFQTNNTKESAGETFGTALLGCMLGFRQYMEQNKINYQLDFATVYNSKKEIQNHYKTEVLANWYKIDGDGNMFPAGTKNSFYIDIKYYLMNIRGSAILNNKIKAGVFADILPALSKTKNSK